MQSLNDAAQQQAVRKTVWLLCAVALNALEFFIPRLPFFPWLKPGLANIITILWIIEYGAVDAVLFSLLRTWIVGFYFGFSFLTISLAMSGGVLSTITMGIFWSLLGKNKLLGTIGLGTIGAAFHNAGQLCAVYALMAANLHLFYQIPVMLIASVIFGGIVGLLAPLVYKVVGPGMISMDSQNNFHLPAIRASSSNHFFSWILLCSCIAIVFSDSYEALCACAVAASLIVQIQLKGSIKAFFKPMSGFWVLFVFIACVDLFFSYGTRIEIIPFVTHEGVDATLKQWLRLWTWLQVSSILSYFNFHAVMLQTLRAIFKRHDETIFAGVLALEYFPGIAEDGKRFIKNKIAVIFGRKEEKILKNSLEGSIETNWITALVTGLYKLVILRVIK
ncbi:MAG TPA: Gx transporter family protein [Chitinivibrionales bacterium]|nr:Gx transporter family protein [Chitinivibrionales bacterium]